MDWQATVRRAVKIGSQNGFMTFDQINEVIPPSAHRPVEPDLIEALLEALNARGINVTDR